MKITSILIPVISFSLLNVFTSCANDTKAEEPDLAKQEVESFITLVDGQLLEKKMFTVDVLSNSKLEASQMADLNFSISGIITKIYVKNGQKVSKGTLLAQLDDKAEQINYLNSKESYHKVMIDFADRLLSYGYIIEDTAKVPKDIMTNIKIATGYNTAENNLKTAKISLDQKKLYAPFSGQIASLQAKEHNSSSSFKIFCKLVNYDKLQLKFKIMESEYSLVSAGDGVEVNPIISETKIDGKVLSVDPFVDEKGMVEVLAEIPNNQHLLIPGMNVDVTLQKDIEQRYLLEKSAILDRQNKKVVFKYSNGQALWNYVNITGQNSKYYSVTFDAGMQSGDTVIVSNNLNLAHETKCKFKKIVE